MRRPLFAVVVIAALSLGVGMAASRTNQEPTHLPVPLADEVMLADRFGHALRCAGKLVRVQRSGLGGDVPRMTPEQAVQLQSRARLGAPISPELIAPSFERFSCARNARGLETGDAIAHVTEPSGRTSTRMLENTNE